jgi:hypothetical protein
VAVIALIWTATRYSKSVTFRSQAQLLVVEGQRLAYVYYEQEPKWLLSIHRSKSNFPDVFWNIIFTRPTKQ